MSDQDRAAVWLRRCEELAAIAQIGLTYAKDPFDQERYGRLRDLAGEMIGDLAGLPAAAVQDWLCLDERYATPKLDVRGVVLRGGTILMVRERQDGLWSLPGGWCEVNQSPGETAVKELREETGLGVRPVRLLALFDKHKHDHPPQLPHALKAFFLCEEDGSGALAAQTAEAAEVAFMPLAALPPLSLHRVTAAQIATMAALARQPGAAPLFD